jgi:hypothetical protein
MQMDDEGKTAEDFSDREKVVFKIYKKLNSANQHKMIPIPICLIPDVLKTTTQFYGFNKKKQSLSNFFSYIAFP